MKKTLDALYGDFDFAGRVRYDPIRIPKKYKRKRDVEVAGFIAAGLAYGKVSLFLPVVERILSLMGESPYDYLRGFEVKKHGRRFTGIGYRFQRDRDIVALLYILSKLIKRFGSLEAAFNSFYNIGDLDTGRAMAGFSAAALAVDTSPVYGDNRKTRGLLHLFPSPEGGGACKRMNLFLRWMVRDRDIDFGHWRWLGKDHLVIPLDVHIARISRCLGLAARRSADWKTAVEITASLRELDPEDPLKYDFALCHRGIAGLCKQEGCGGCDLKGLSGLVK